LINPPPPPLLTDGTWFGPEALRLVATILNRYIVVLDSNNLKITTTYPPDLRPYLLSTPRGGKADMHVDYLTSRNGASLAAPSPAFCLETIVLMFDGAHFWCTSPLNRDTFNGSGLSNAFKEAGHAVWELKPVEPASL